MDFCRCLFSYVFSYNRNNNNNTYELHNIFVKSLVGYVTTYKNKIILIVCRGSSESESNLKISMKMEVHNSRSNCFDFVKKSKLYFLGTKT